MYINYIKGDQILKIKHQVPTKNKTAWNNQRPNVSSIIHPALPRRKAIGNTLHLLHSLVEKELFPGCWSRQLRLRSKNFLMSILLLTLKWVCSFSLFIFLFYGLSIKMKEAWSALPGLNGLSMINSRRESCMNQEKQFY